MLSLTALSAFIPSTVAVATPILQAATDGHTTTPVWYHDSTIAGVGGTLFVGWNTNTSSIQVRPFSRSKRRWLAKATTVSTAVLDCGCLDSTGTNPDRHDVPTFVSDPAGRLYAFYGGGTASHMGPKTGPYFRAATALRSSKSWGPEQLLPFPGSAYDLEAVRDNRGVNHLIGQQGDSPGGAGSIVYFRLHPGSSTSPGTLSHGEVLVAGGNQPGTCPWVPGCDVFVIGRLSEGPSDPTHPHVPNTLFLTWGWSEMNLSNSCNDPAGFCDRGLYLAESRDGGRTWSNAAETTRVTPAVKPIAYDDPAFQVVGPSSDVGLFKAVAIKGNYPGKPWIAYQAGADEHDGRIWLARWTGSHWSKRVLDHSRSWNDSLVMRTTSSGRVYLWTDIAQTGLYRRKLAQWVWQRGSWRRSYVDVGPNWFLTGQAVPGGEALEWRVPNTAGAQSVGFTIVPVR